MFWGLWAPFLLLLGSLHKYRQMKKIEELRKQKEKAGENITDEAIYSDMEDSE
jgi:hypothetical protein